MNHRRFPRSIAAALLLQGSAFLASVSAQDYEIELMAVTGPQLFSIEEYVSINDEGQCAFTGRDAANVGRGFLVSAPVAGGGIPTPVTSSFANRSFLGIALNNSYPPLLAIRDEVAGTTNSWFVRRWAPAIPPGSPTFTLLGRSTTVTGPATFDFATPFVDINDDGKVAFSGLINGSTQTALFVADAFTTLPACCTSPCGNAATNVCVFNGAHVVAPQISNAYTSNLGTPVPASVVFRDATNQVAVFDTGTLTTTNRTFVPPPSPPAASNQFYTVGNKPGISPDGRIAAWIGNRGAGEGVFVSYPNSSPDSILRVAGEGLDSFTDFDDTQRVGVITADLPGRADPLMTVVFAGTVGGVPGIYAVYRHARVRTSPTTGLPVLTHEIGPPNLVARAGDFVSGFNAPISAMTLYDPINRCGQIAFRATFTSGAASWQGVVRATRRPPPMKTVRVSAKRVLSPAGAPTPPAPSPFWRCNVEAAVNEASRLLENAAHIKLCLEEVVDVPATVTVGGTTHVLFDMASGYALSIENAAKNNPVAFAWRHDAINMYFVNSIGTQLGTAIGRCAPPPSDPCGIGADAEEIIFFAPQSCATGVPVSVADSGQSIAHELGHYFNLYHLFSIACAVELPPMAWPAPATHAPNACIAGDFVADTPPSLNETGLHTASPTLGLWYPVGSNNYVTVSTNLMTYYCGITTLTRGQAVRAHQAIELFRRHVVIPDGGATVNIVGAGCSGNALGGPRLGLTPLRMGYNSIITVSGAPASSLLGLWYSAPTTSFLSLGGPCCYGYLDFSAFYDFGNFPTNASGQWTYTLPVPLNPSLSGFTFALQGLVVGGSGYSGFDLTSGLVAVVGT